MAHQTLKNPSALKHKDWQVRAIVGVGAHAAVGGTAQLFEFKKKGEHASYAFVFAGVGVGGGGKGGAGGSNFETPHMFLYDTARIVGTAFYEAGRQMLGGERRKISNDYYQGMMSFSDLQVTTAFSTIDLNGAYGNLIEGSVSFGMGYGVTIISAEKSGNILFPNQPTSGDGVAGEGLIGGAAGVAAGASVNYGYWYQV